MDEKKPLEGKKQKKEENWENMDYDLDRFKEAQRVDYPIALEEIKSDYKKSHWMWYIFPQLKNLGYSPTAKYYGIDGKNEAIAYLADEILRSRLIEISKALLSLETSNATEIFGYPDDMKLKSCMTLFSAVAPQINIFEKVLEKFFAGERDEKTLDLIGTE